MDSVSVIKVSLLRTAARRLVPRTVLIEVIALTAAVCAMKASLGWTAQF